MALVYLWLECVWTWKAAVDAFCGGCGETGEIVGQNVKLESIRARFRGNEWLIVAADRRQGGTIPALFTPLSTPSGDVSACCGNENIHSLQTALRQMKTSRQLQESRGVGCVCQCWQQRRAAFIWLGLGWWRVRALHLAGRDWAGRWLLSLTGRLAGTLAALCSLPSAHRLLLAAVDRSLPLLGGDVAPHLTPSSTHRQV